MKLLKQKKNMTENTKQNMEMSELTQKTRQIFQPLDF